MVGVAAPAHNQVAYGPFIGGLNTRDAYTEIAANELATCRNGMLDERGVLTKRNHCPDSASFPNPPGAPITFFYSAALSRGILQVGTTLYKCAVGGGSWTSFRTTGSSAPVAMCDFHGKLVYIHPVDGTRTYDGTTDAAVASGVSGTCIAAWQNKVWLGGYSGAPATRLFWSNAGDPTTFTTASDYVDLNEKDDKPITALFPSSGLLAFKEDSFYRVNDSTTGSYQTIDWQAGSVGPRSLIGQDGQIYFWGLDGLYATNGIGPGVNVGDKVRPIYSSDGINGTTKPKISATAVNGRVYFAFPNSGSSDLDQILTYHPRVGWVMITDFTNNNISGFARYPNAAGQQIVAFTNATGVTYRVKDLFTSLSRTSYDFIWTTGYQEPFNGLPARIPRFLPEITVPSSASVAFGINYTDDGGYAKSYTETKTLTNSGTQRTRLQPKILGRAFQVTMNDTASPLSSMSVLQLSLDAQLAALR